MNISKARDLRVGDAVIAPFSNSHREAVIMKIEWPKFTVTGNLASGESRTEVRHYRTLENIRKTTDMDRKLYAAMQGRGVPKGK